MFDAITSRIKTVQGWTIRDLYRELFYSPGFTDLIIRLNTEGEAGSQLAHGVDATNTDLSEIGGEYSPYTKMLKAEKSGVAGITDFVTLKYTGDFYRSFRCQFRDSGNGEIEITADTIKEGGVDLLTRWGKNIIGLDDQSLETLRAYALEQLRTILLTKLNQAA